MKTNFTFDNAGPTGRPRTPVELMMTPMIDVVFLLLVFFLATSTFQIVEMAMPGGITKDAAPATASGSDATDEPPEPSMAETDVIVSIEMDAEFQPIFKVNAAAIGGLPELKQRLQRIIAVKNDVPIVIDPNNDVPLGFAIAAFDNARAAGAIRVFLVAGLPAD
jgi:biopolymer transport protein ExbD